MFTFTSLGNMGRFGNQLFQIAATIGLARKHGDSYIFPPWEHADLFAQQIPQATSVLRPDIALMQRCFHFVDVSISVGGACLIDLVGYFQSEEFFRDSVAEVRRLFEPNAAISTALHLEYDAIIARQPTCVVVVRRGDYLQHVHSHPPQTAEFYAEAMTSFDTDTMFFVTSDDIEWCREHLHAKHLVFLPQSAWIHNFFLGTLCHDTITANTTFGWWIAYLNKNAHKRVVAPRRWFGPARPHHDTRHLIPSGWMTI